MVVGSHGMFTLCFLVFDHICEDFSELSSLSFAERNVKQIQLNFFLKNTFDWALHSWCLHEMIISSTLSVMFTPWKINMEPGNDGLEADFPFQLGDF